jgi:hypothetical protein
MGYYSLCCVPKRHLAGMCETAIKLHESETTGRGVTFCRKFILIDLEVAYVEGLDIQ